MQVTVIHTATLQPEYLVKEKDDLILPCFAFYKHKKTLVEWSLETHKTEKLISRSQILSNGSIHIKSMSEDQSGIYTCTATLPNKKKSSIATRVRVKPEIILSQGKSLNSSEGKDVLLECLLVSPLPNGTQVKRVWQFNGEFELGDRTRSTNQGGLLMIKQAHPSDSGNYTCLALEKGTTRRLAEIKYSLKIDSNRLHWTPGEQNVSCSKVKDQPVSDLKAFKIDNSTVGITWTLPKYFNRSCYDHISLLWWTDLSNSSFEDKNLLLEKTQVTLSGLEEDLTYYVQVNLIAHLKVKVYGHTLAFNLLDLEYGSFPKIESDEQNDVKYSSTPDTMVLVIISLVVVFVCIILALHCEMATKTFEI